MSFVGSTLRSVGSFIGKTFGLVPDTPTPAPAPVAPTFDSAKASEDMDMAAQKQAAAMGGGRTSTVLSGNDGVEEDTKATSKVLLGK